MDTSNEVEHKTYLFETQTRRLKQYYSKNLTQLMNCRVIFNNSVGTIRYVGELKHQGKPLNSEGEVWVGLQWDEEGRGKHNGVVNNFEYFKCSQKKGSLVKFQKIQFGYKLETALFRRYFRVEQLHHAKDIYENLKAYRNELKDQESPHNQQDHQSPILKKTHKVELDAEVYINTFNKKKRVMVQFIGFDEIWSKINNLDKLQSISLSECRICDFGEKGHLNGILSGLKILSLQDNLLSHWNQIMQLGLQLPNLTQLSLANNRIAEPDFDDIKQLKTVEIGDQGSIYPLENNPSVIFPSIRCLILINTGLSWKSLFKISACFQLTLQQLILCKNNLSDMENIDEQKINRMKQLCFLNVEQTELTTFEGLKKFNQLQNLQKIIVNRNKIEEIGKISGFDHLKHLSVQFCAINNPVVISQISQFKELESLNIKHNPVGERMGNSHVRMRSVAEIAKLKVVNGSMLRKYQRKDCEIYYLRESFKQYFMLKDLPDYDYDFNDFLAYCEHHHPNIQYFIKKYGNPYEVEEKKQIKEIVKKQVADTLNKKGTGMVLVKICNKVNQSQETKKIPLSWTISSLKNFFAKMYKIPVGVQYLACQIDGESEVEEMTEDHKNVGFYSLKNDSIIIVDKKP